MSTKNDAIELLGGMELPRVLLPSIQVPSNMAINTKKAFEQLIQMADTNETLYVYGIECTGKTTMIKRFMELNNQKQTSSQISSNDAPSTPVKNSSQRNEEKSQLLLSGRRTPKRAAAAASIKSASSKKNDNIKLKNKDHNDLAMVTLGQVFNIYIDCVLAVSPSEIYREILQALIKMISRSSRYAATHAIPHATPAHRFMEYLNDMVNSHKDFFLRSRIYIVLDHVDHLERPNYNEMLLLLAHLKEFYGPYLFTSFRTIFLAQCSPEHFDSISQLGKFYPFPIIVEPFDKRDITDWILSERPIESEHIYDNFVKNIVNLFYSKSKSYEELRYLCQESFSRFLTFYDTMLMDEKDCYDSMDSLNSSKTSSDQDQENHSRTNNGTNFTQKNEIPFHKVWKKFSENIKQENDIYVNYLNSRQVNSRRCDPTESLLLSQDIRTMLVAAYIASHTARSDDKINFSKAQPGRITNRRTKAVNNQIDQNSAFVDDRCKPFTIERVFQIGQRLKDETFSQRIQDPKDTDFSDSLQHAVATLVSCRLLRAYCRDGCSSLNKYVITDVLDFTFAKSLARSCGVKLEDYLGLSS